MSIGLSYAKFYQLFNGGLEIALRGLESRVKCKNVT